MHKPINPHQPITFLFKQIEDAQNFATAENIPFRKTQLIKVAKTLILGTGQYNQAYRVWIALPEAQKMFLNLKQ